MKQLDDYSGAFNPRLKLADFSKDAVSSLLMATIKNYIGIDGLWLTICRKKFGDQEGFNLEKMIWNEYAVVDQRRCAEALGIKGNDVATCFKGIQMNPSTGIFLDIVFDLKNANHGIMTVTRCASLEYYERHGDDAGVRFVCEEIEKPGWQAQASYFNPAIKVTPLKLPPRKARTDLCCQWEYKLDSGS